MKIKPKLAYRHGGFLSNTALNPDKVYDAIPATNLPDWKEKGKIFVQCPNGAPELLLENGEYEVVN